MKLTLSVNPQTESLGNDLNEGNWRMNKLICDEQVFEESPSLKNITSFEANILEQYGKQMKNVLQHFQLTDCKNNVEGEFQEVDFTSKQVLLNIITGNQNLNLEEQETFIQRITPSLHYLMLASFNELPLMKVNKCLGIVSVILKQLSSMKLQKLDEEKIMNNIEDFNLIDFSLLRKFLNCSTFQEKYRIQIMVKKLMRIIVLAEEGIYKDEQHNSKQTFNVLI